MMLTSFRIALIATAVALSGPALARPPVKPPVAIGQFGDWQAFSTGAGKAKSCFAITSPKERKPAGLQRDAATLFITRRPGEGVRNEISMITGFTMADGGEAHLKVGTQTFLMVTKGSNAWIKNTAEEASVIAAMRKGRDVLFEARSKRGKKTVDSYALQGLKQALEAIAKSCP